MRAYGGSLQIAKFKLHQYEWRAISPNLNARRSFPLYSRYSQIKKNQPTCTLFRIGENKFYPVTIKFVCVLATFTISDCGV
jgi:hypothetical protein